MLSYYGCVATAIVLIYFCETYLNTRQRRKLQESEASPTLLENGLTSKEEFVKSQKYGLEKMNFAMFRDVINTAEQLAFITFGYVWFWRFVSAFAVHRYVQSLIFMVAYFCFETLLSTPFSYYANFVIEERHGFNKQTLSIFVKDIIKQMAITAAIIAVLVPAMLWIIDYFGDDFVAFLWLFISLFLLLMMWLAPSLMACFYRFDALNEEVHCLTPKTKGLKDALDALAQTVAFPLKKIFVMDGSTRSSHSNAFQYGFCSNKRIVLFDTLLQQMSKEEICSVMCHELGHWRFSHTIKGLVLTECQLFVTFLLFKGVYNNERFYRSFHFEAADDMPIIVGLMLFSHLLAPVSVLLSLLQNALTRAWEYQADEFAVELNHGQALYNALVVLFKENKAKLDPDYLYEAYHHNHPSALPRLNALKAALEKNENKTK